MATMSTVWDRTAEFLSDNLAAVAPLALLTLFVPVSVLGNLTPLFGTMGPAGNLALSVVMLAVALVTVWGTLAITALALDPGGGRAAAVAAANQRLLPTIGISLALLAAALLLALPVAVALGLSGMNAAAFAGGTADGAPRLTMADAQKLFLVFVVFGLLFLWLQARLALLYPTIVMERRGLGSVPRSFVLTRHIQWKLVGVLILYLVVSSVATAAARGVFGSVLALLIGGEGPATLASVLTAIIVAGISTGFSLVAIVFAARLYLATRDAREAIVEGAVGGL